MQNYYRSDFTWRIKETGNTAKYIDNVEVWRDMCEKDLILDSSGDYLYKGEACECNKALDLELRDTPGKVLAKKIYRFSNPNGSLSKELEQSTIAYTELTFDASNYTYYHDFIVWLVVGNVETEQYVPLVQQGWTCYKQASDVTWSCNIQNNQTTNVIALPPSNPKTIADTWDYRDSTAESLVYPNSPPQL